MELIKDQTNTAVEKTGKVEREYDKLQEEHNKLIEHTKKLQNTLETVDNRACRNNLKLTRLKEGVEGQDLKK